MKIPQRQACVQDGRHIEVGENMAEDSIARVQVDRRDIQHDEAI